jgi:hypothetical protein
MTVSILKRYQAALKRLGSQRKAAKAVGIPRSTIQEMLKREDTFKTAAPAKAVVVPTPKRKTRRFIFSAAQNGTEVHEQFLTNLEAYAEYLDASLHIAGFTYNKRLFEENRKDDPKQWYHPRIKPYLTDRQFDLGASLVFCGNMNTLPTAVSPLSGFETYTRGRTGIFPHAKIQFVSVPTLKDSEPKFITTTGAVTLPNYVQKRAGIKAHFHHVNGAVLVEIDSDGDWFLRHLNAEDDGSFQDLTRYVKNGKVTDGHAVEAIVWGDLHTEEADPDVLWGSFGIDSLGQVHRGECMLDWLAPRYQFIHDVTDFRPRNHHSIKDPLSRLKMNYWGREEVDRELDEVAELLTNISRPGTRTVVVESNHDLALLRWLKEADWRADPANAKFMLEAQLECVRAVQRGEEDFSPLEWALRRKKDFDTKGEIEFLRQDQSFTVKGIECGMHGHLGVNGARATPRQFTKLGPKCFTGHTHTAGILDGVYTVGTSSKLDMGYNHGPSSWSHTHGIIYPSGKRALVTLRGDKWCAD